jgi:hypothetical protein
MVESSFLQRRVYCEPDFGSAEEAGDGPNQTPDPGRDSSRAGTSLRPTMFQRESTHAGGENGSNTGSGDGERCR